jgi:hypothetical protein
MVKRHQHVEHAILALVLKCGDHQGYGVGLPTLVSILRERFSDRFPDIDDREVVDTLKRLSPRYITLRKYSAARHGFVRYPDDSGDDSQFFYTADFCIQRTPDTDPYVQTLELEVGPMGMPIIPPPDDDKRARLFAHLESLGLERVKHDLLEHMGRREVGGAPDVRKAAWEWVQEKEAKAAALTKANSAVSTGLVSETRLEELRRLSSSSFDFGKLIRLCEEINIVYGQGCYFSTAMLTRALLDHVPPIFGKAKFDEVANHHGAKSVKRALKHLSDASRSVADGHLHEQISKREPLPTAQQVDCRQQLDVLLREIVRVAE